MQPFHPFSGVISEVLSQEVAAEFPSLPTLLQAAANSSNHVRSVEGEMQLGRKILNALAGTKTSSASWDDVKAEVLRSKSTMASLGPAIFAFLLKFGGGSKGEFWLATERHVRSLGFPSRQLGPEGWDALSGDRPKGEAKTRVRFRHALLKLFFCGPEKALSVADVRRSLLARDATKLDRFEVLLDEVEKVAKAHEGVLGSEKLELMVGKVEADMVAAILEKKFGEPSMEKVAMDFLSSLGELTGKSFEPTWSVPPSKKTAKVTKVKAAAKHGQARLGSQLDGLQMCYPFFVVLIGSLS